MNKTIGDTVSFLLDGSHPGRGVIQRVVEMKRQFSYDVKLMTPCKEFNIGEVIIVDDDEIINDEDKAILHLEIGNEFYLEFGKLIARTLEKVGEDDREGLLAELNDLSSVYGSNFGKYLIK